MKRVTILLAVAVIAAPSGGCGCCGRLRDWLCRGAFCGAPAAPTYAAPAPLAVPPPMSMGAPMPMAAPIAGCPPGYPMETVYEPGCAYDVGMPAGPMYGSGGWAPSGTVLPQPRAMDPGPAP